MMRCLPTALVAVAAALLSACGGGGVDAPVAHSAALEMPAAVTSATTGRALDVAIQGDGQFLWRDDQGRTVYSREASLGLAADGGLVNRSGARLLGLAPGGHDGEALQPLRLPERMAPQATGRLWLEVNLDSRLPVTDLGAQPRIDFALPNTFNNATSATVHDLTGESVAVVVYFQKSADDRWTVYVTANGMTAAGTGEDPQPVAELQFTPDGATVSPSSLTLTLPASINELGVGTRPITLDLALSDATQYGSSFAVTGVRQDGYGAGQLMSLDIDAGGHLTARYHNGQSLDRGRIVLARFDGTERFTPTGQGWLQVLGTAPVVTAPGLGLNGTLRTGMLEVDVQLHDQTGP